MAEESVAALQPHSGGAYVDCTLGAAGHAYRILELSSPDGCLLGLDADPEALEIARQRLHSFGDRATLVHSNFRHLGQVARARGFDHVDGAILDLGLSSMQLDTWTRGFSFRRNEPLDMRFDPTEGRPAAELLATEPEEEIARIIWQYGEETASRRIARAIANSPERISTTGQLAALVERTVGGRRGRVHPATRTFQALRIAVNDELGALEQGLNAAIGLLAPGGRMVVISFHSLEDRLVKNLFRIESSDCICPPRQPVCTCGHKARLRLVQRKAIKPGDPEVEVNPRSRSARMRVAERLQT